MANLTKRDLVVEISNETGKTQQDVLEILQKILDKMLASLASGRPIQLRNFGVFVLEKRRRRVGRNPNKPEKDIMIPERVVVKFKPGKEMKLRIRLLKPNQIQASIETDDDEEDHDENTD